MFGPFLGTPPSHYDPDEPRDWHGRWTPGGSASSWRNTPPARSYPVTAAIRAIGADRWPAVLERLEDRADAALPMASALRNRTASRAREDQPIDSERGRPSGLIQLASGHLGGAVGDPAKPDSDNRSSKIRDGLQRYLSESWDSPAQAPSDIGQMARELIKDQIAFLAAIGPSLAGLGISIQPKVGNVYLQASIEASVTQEGLDFIARHLARLDGGDYPGNLAMIDHLKAQLGSKITGPDFSYYVHEIMESRLLDLGLDYESAHEFVLAVAGISRYAIYPRKLVRQHPEWFARRYRAYWGIE